MPGYDELAMLFGKNDDLAMVRRFGPLNAKLLLYMQAELLLIEDQLREQVREDLATNPEGMQFATYWKALNDAPDNGFGSWQKQKVSAAKSKMEEYYRFLLLTAQINGLAKPRDCDYQYLTEWLRRPTGGDGFLKSVEARAWKEPYQFDLVLSALQSKERDRFAQFMSDKIVPCYHRLIGQRLHKQVSDEHMLDTWEYKQERFVFLCDLICMLLASAVPTISIFVLYFQRNTIRRVLTTVTVMSFIVSAIMTFVVQARRVDVFAATMAFAAVQVVFLGGQPCRNQTSRT